MSVVAIHTPVDVEVDRFSTLPNRLHRPMPSQHAVPSVAAGPPYTSGTLPMPLSNAMGTRQLHPSLWPMQSTPQGQLQQQQQQQYVPATSTTTALRPSELPTAAPFGAATHVHPANSFDESRMMLAPQEQGNAPLRSNPSAAGPAASAPMYPTLSAALLGMGGPALNAYFSSAAVPPPPPNGPALAEQPPSSNSQQYRTGVSSQAGPSSDANRLAHQLVSSAAPYMGGRASIDPSMWFAAEQARSSHGALNLSAPAPPKVRIEPYGSFPLDLGRDGVYATGAGAGGGTGGVPAPQTWAPFPQGVGVPIPMQLPLALPPALPQPHDFGAQSAARRMANAPTAVSLSNMRGDVKPALLYPSPPSGSIGSASSPTSQLTASTGGGALPAQVVSFATGSASSSSSGALRKGDSDYYRHTCSHCGMKFRGLTDLTRHTRRHTGEKPYACEECGKPFRQKSTLRVHMRIHTGEKPHRCVKCDTPFRHKTSLFRHLDQYPACGAAAAAAAGDE